MHTRGVSRLLGSAVLAAVVVLSGLTACTSPSAPVSAPLPDYTPGPNDQLAGAWHSTADGPLHVEGLMPDRPMPELPRPAGWLFHIRARCTGSGKLAIHERAKNGDAVSEEAPCVGKWAGSWASLPHHRYPESEIDLGPYTVTIDSADTITSWDVEAYGTPIVNFYQQAPSPSPTG
jgi:hypothetical protein